MIRTEKSKIGAALERAGIADRISTEFAEAAGLTQKEQLHLCLLAEEMIGMLYAVSDLVEGTIWAEGGDGCCELHLEASASLDAGKRRELISAASDGRNAAAQGFMDMLGEFISGAVYDLEQTIGWLASETFKNGMTAMGTVAAPMADANMIPVWSLEEYKANLRRKGDGDADAALDSLEKSIVVNLADNVVVGVRDNIIDLVILMHYGN